MLNKVKLTFYSNKQVKEFIYKLLVPVSGTPDGTKKCQLSEPEESSALQYTPKYFREIFPFPGLVSRSLYPFWEKEYNTT